MHGSGRIRLLGSADVAQLPKLKGSKMRRKMQKERPN